MHTLLSKLLKKRGIENEEDLSKDEREWFKEKERVLSVSDTISVEDVKKFCELQVSSVVNEFANLDNSKRKNERLVVVFSVYNAILKSFTASKQERETLEDYLEQLIKE
mgnify:FL=1